MYCLVIGLVASTLLPQELTRKLLPSPVIAELTGNGWTIAPALALAVSYEMNCLGAQSNTIMNLFD